MAAWEKWRLVAWRSLAGWLSAALLLGVCTRADAIGDAPLYHSRWGREDGAPAEVEAIAQSADGSLWLGSVSGLVRFDGVSFDASVQSRLPRKDIAALVAGGDGSLWIGYRRGGLSRLLDGELRHFGVDDGLPDSGVLSLAQDHRGRLWVATPDGLLRQSAQGWQPVGGEQGYSGNRPTELFVDRQGVLWVGDSAGLFRSNRDDRFEWVEPGSAAPLHIAQSPDGSTWTSDSVRGLRRVGSGSSTPVTRGGSILADRDGMLWISTLPGLVRLRADAPTQSLAVSEESQAAVLSMFEDREGVLWLGTRRGLERLRTAKFARVELPPMLETLAAADREAMSCPRCPTPHTSLFLALAPAADDAVWVGSRQQLMLAKDGAVAQETLASRISSAYRDPHGVLWLGGEAALWRVAGQRVESLRLPQAVDNPQDQVQSMTLDANGRLWVSIARKGVYRRDGDGWTLAGGVAQLPLRPAIAMLTDSRGRLWFSYKDSRVAMLDGESLRLFGSESGLVLGPVLALYERNGRVWAGGERGLMRFDGERFHAVSGSDGDPFNDTSGIVETSAGDLWLSTAAGAIRIASEDVENVTRDPRYRVRFERFDDHDGLDGSAEQVRPLPTLVRGDDGRLWFATTTTLAWIDPERIARNPLVPAVHVTALRSGRDVFAPNTGLVLPKGTTQLQIDYSALSLAMPERVRFRYRLDGVDAGWQDAGTRRTAFYTNLDRGPHRFHVTASNEDGLWNEKGTSIEFSIAPTVTQTLWFRFACFLSGFCFLWLLYLLRLRQMSERIRVRFEARQAERERIARELHDTLLQGFQGVILRLQAVLLQSREPDVRVAMEEALERADAVLIEGRDRVRQVREGRQSEELGEAVAGVGNELIRGSGMRFRLIEQGVRRHICPIVRDELYAICREALFNTVLHAGAQSVEVEIGYGTHSLRIIVRDDGRGIAPEILASGRRPGHFGLQGMRERSDRLGAVIEFRSRVGVGTEIMVRVPAPVAYGGAEKVPLMRRLMRLLLAEDVVERAGPAP